MIVIRAKALGMCFGVRAALDKAFAVEAPQTTSIHGELVHNELIQARLARRGFEQRAEADRAVPSDRPDVLITAHGVSERERERLRLAGKQLIDTTCPLVRRIHATAQMLARQGYFIVIIGRPGHVEVEGLTGDLAEFAVVASPEEAREYAASRIAVICQSTTAPLTAEAVLAEIQRRNPQREIRYEPTMCHPTLDRQLAALELLEQVEALVVVGGRTSNNSRELARLAEIAGRPHCLVQSAADLDSEWLAQFNCVGLTAGTSTPDDVVEDVEARMRTIAPRQRMVS